MNTNDSAHKEKLLSIFNTTNHDDAVALAVFDTSDNLAFTVTYKVGDISTVHENNRIAIDGSNNRLGNNPITDQIFKVILHPT